MAIVFSPDVEREIEELLRNGRFASADEFARCTIEQCNERDRWLKELASREDVKQQIEEGLRDLEEGNYTDYDEAGLRAFFEQIKREGRQEMGLPANDA